MDSDSDSGTGGAAAAATGASDDASAAAAPREPTPFEVAYAEVQKALDDSLPQWDGYLTSEPPTEARVAAFDAFDSFMRQYTGYAFGGASDRAWRSIRALIRAHQDLLVYKHTVKQTKALGMLEDFGALQRLIVLSPRAAVKIITQNAAYMVERFHYPQVACYQFVAIYRVFRGSEPALDGYEVDLPRQPAYVRKLITATTALLVNGFKMPDRLRTHVDRLPKSPPNERLQQLFRELAANRELVVSRVALLAEITPKDAADGTSSPLGERIVLGKNPWFDLIPPAVLLEIVHFSSEMDDRAVLSTSALRGYYAAREAHLAEEIRRRRDWPNAKRARPAARGDTRASSPPPLVRRDEV